ncbi:MAG: hydroxyacid dehydrogenase [Thermodesulfobacteriota bacterium]
MDVSKILIEAKPFALFDSSPMEALVKTGIKTVDMRGRGVNHPEFVDELKDASIILCGNDLRVDESFLKLTPSLRGIAKLGVGLDTIHIPSASKKKIPVFHTPGANTQAVADHTFALILSVSRKILYCDSSLREGRWEHTRILGIELWQKTLGLIGLGAIGRAVASRAKGFEMRIVAYDPFWPSSFADANHIQKMEIEDLLRISDFVSIHSPLTEENRGLINRRTLGIMKPSALLINTARGEIINEIDLCEALENGKIAGAGIDVFEKEPPTDSPLLKFDNVVLTPHTGAFTKDALNTMSLSISDQILEFIKGNRPKHTVNPEVFEKK